MAKRVRTIDLRKLHEELYRAKPAIQEVAAGKGTYLAVDGAGEPGGKGFQDAIMKLFSLVYTAKFMLKREGLIDFSIPSLECLWPDDPKTKPMTEWRWRLMIRIPDEVTRAHLAPARKSLAERKGTDTKDVRRVSWKEGMALQVLHVGPYEKLGETYNALVSAAAERGYDCAGPGHEVYLSDPRRTAPERLKTIVRIAVRRARG
ncbi:MAG: GyrI-like domain-containing protein [Acidobacteriota bacterium]